MLSRTRIATIATVLALAGCGEPGPEPSDTTDDSGVGAKAAADGAPDMPGAPDTPEGSEGTRENPLPPDETFRMGEWEVTFEATDRDAAETLIDGDRFMREIVTNDIPPGSAAVLVPIVMVFTGADSGHPWDLRISFVDGTGNTVTQRCPGFYEDDYVLAGEMFTGADATVTACAVVPEDRIDGGMWLVEEPYQSLDQPQERVFVGLGAP